MRPGRAADHSPPSSAAVMEENSYTSTHPLGHTGPVTGKHYFSFTWEVNSLTKKKKTSCCRADFIDYTGHYK